MSESAVDVPFRIHDRSVFFPDAETLVIADVHLGRGATSSVDAPLEDGADAADRLRRVLRFVDPSTVVVAGDLLHSFSWIPRGVEDDLASLARTIDRADASLVVTRGNHDTVLESVFDGEIADAYRIEDDADSIHETVVCHGHERPDVAADLYVLGHDHPAISIDGRKRPCFLYGPGGFDGRDVLVVPAFTRLARGTTVNRLSGSDFQSPLVTDADALYPAVWDDATEEPLWFPPLGACRRLL